MSKLEWVSSMLVHHGVKPIGDLEKDFMTLNYIKPNNTVIESFNNELKKLSYTESNSESKCKKKKRNQRKVKAPDQEGYTPPSPCEIRALMAANGWNQENVAKLVGVSFKEKSGSATVKKWLVNEGGKTKRNMPYSAWRLLLSYSGVTADKSEATTILK